MIEFNLEEDFHRAWLWEKWYVKRFSMRVFKWTLDFSVNAESSIAPIWVNFHCLYVHLFNKQSLFSIESVLDSPMKIDAANSSLTRPSVAHICIVMDLLKKFHKRVWIGCGHNGFWKKISY